MNLLSSWTEEYSSEDSLRILTEFAHQHSLECGDPVLIDALSRLMASRVITKEIPLLKFIVEYQTPYDRGLTVVQLIHHRQALAFFSKSEFLDLGIDRSAVALEKFESAEEKCRETNEAFKAWQSGRFHFFPDVESVFHSAAQKIAKVLGPVPQLSELKLRFGPGATTLTKRRDASARRKLSAGVSCSENLFPAAHAVMEEVPTWACFLGDQPSESADVVSLPVAVTPGKVSFVLKNAKTFRAIVTEPVLNGICQLGIGDYLSNRLAAFGLDLSDQTLNQRLAREGSLTGALATLDLSSASDTISTELVYHLLPIDWACFLDRFRSRTVTCAGRSFVQHKFSSMGNGFTFPLETLIFWALTKSCCEPRETVSVYGDDIICPSHRYAQVTRVLQAAGFEVNLSKSYAEGPFRESCGADYFEGFDIRPSYHKSLVSGASLFVLHNFYVRNYMFDYAESVRKYIHQNNLIYGPDGFGDGHLLGDYPRVPHKREIGYSGFLFDSFVRKANRDRSRFLPGDGVLPSYSIYVSGSYPPCEPDAVRRIHGRIVEQPPRDGFTIPGWSSYKRISIYTLRAT